MELLLTLVFFQSLLWPKILARMPKGRSSYSRLQETSVLTRIIHAAISNLLPSLKSEETELPKALKMRRLRCQEVQAKFQVRREGEVTRRRG